MSVVSVHVTTDFKSEKTFIQSQVGQHPQNSMHEQKNSWYFFHDLLSVVVWCARQTTFPLEPTRQEIATGNHEYDIWSGTGLHTVPIYYVNYSYLIYCTQRGTVCPSPILTVIGAEQKRDSQRTFDVAIALSLVSFSFQYIRPLFFDFLWCWALQNHKYSSSFKSYINM